MKFILSLFTLLFLSANVFAAQSIVVKIIVYKSERKMVLLDADNTVLKSYKIALGGEPIGKKTEEGDEKTPEGHYKIVAHKPDSRFHLSLRISYPDAQDIAQAEKRGVKPGGDIMIHGMRNGFGWIGSWHLYADTWTDGCIAVTNAEMDEIYNLVIDGTPIDIQP